MKTQGIDNFSQEHTKNKPEQCQCFPPKTEWEFYRRSLGFCPSEVLKQKILKDKLYFNATHTVVVSAEAL